MVYGRVFGGFRMRKVSLDRVYDLQVDRAVMVRSRNSEGEGVLLVQSGSEWFYCLEGDSEDKELTAYDVVGDYELYKFPAVFEELRQGRNDDAVKKLQEWSVKELGLELPLEVLKQEVYRQEGLLKAEGLGEALLTVMFE